MVLNGTIQLLFMRLYVMMFTKEFYCASAKSSFNVSPLENKTPKYDSSKYARVNICKARTYTWDQMVS